MGCQMSPANDQYTSLARTKYTNQKVRIQICHPTNEKLEQIWKHQFGISALQIANQHWLLRHRPPCGTRRTRPQNPQSSQGRNRLQISHVI